MPQTRTAPIEFGTQRWELPPLILHPFSDQSGPSKLLDSSRASLMLSGLLPSEEVDEEELTRRLLEGRLCEIRMLFFMGKDLMRWLAHCEDFVARVPDLAAAGIRQQSFAELLIRNPPQLVRNKLREWGVVDYPSIFSRAIGLNTVFSQPPDFDNVTVEFVRNYYRYADHLYACQQQLQPFAELNPDNFHFEIYASGEYSRKLEKAWGNQ